MQHTLIVIPARYASTRFPGKPLALLSGKPMVQWVYENASETGFKTVVATDDERILKAVEGFGGLAVLTNPNHTSGTDRCLEAAEKASQIFNTHFNIVVNVQGDEPFIKKEQIVGLVKNFEQPDTDISTLVTPVESTESYSVIADPNKVKLVMSTEGKALYFSRSPIPFLRGEACENWSDKHDYFLHLGMYAYRMDVLSKITQLPVSKLEKAESLEQLRWLENGYQIRVSETNHRSVGVDTPEDLEQAQALV